MCRHPGWRRLRCRLRRRIEARKTSSPADDCGKTLRASNPFHSAAIVLHFAHDQRKMEKGALLSRVALRKIDFIDVGRGSGILAKRCGGRQNHWGDQPNRSGPMTRPPVTHTLISVHGPRRSPSITRVPSRLSTDYCVDGVIGGRVIGPDQFDRQPGGSACDHDSLPVYQTRTLLKNGSPYPP
jgi:hypothetical protein